MIEIPSTNKVLSSPHRPRIVRRDELAERLAGELAAAWREGKRPRAEDFLARHADVGDSPDSAARIIYEEVCMREWLGIEVETTELAARFPLWKNELKALMDCHRLFHPKSAVSGLPQVGDTLGDYRLEAVLGRGMRGCVFVARQQTLADRPVVLKVTRRRGWEHLSLARLQHPHVVPLYAVHDFAELDLRALCMPYLGGATLDQVLAKIEDFHPAKRRGADVLEVLDRVRTELIASPAWSGTRQLLAGATYDRAVCWLGACLAEALHYAHVRGLLHLDIKPSNILLADDGQPMLLDFHLARGPLFPGGDRPEALGGTRGYMSPEQGLAMIALGEGREVPAIVDGRSDVYSLGVVLFEALAGFPPPFTEGIAACLLRGNPRVGAGLAAVVAKCLAHDPLDRYTDAAALAADLRRLLGYLPLQGVPRCRLSLRWLSSWRRPRD